MKTVLITYLPVYFFKFEFRIQGLDLIQALFPKHAAVAEETFSVLESNELATLGKLLKKIGKANAVLPETDNRRAT